jgi:putative redox protein
VARVDAVAAAQRLDGRPLLVLHGIEDSDVPVDDARALAEAGAPLAELRLVQGAGHRLRHDPRAIATLLGWLDRQVP